MLALQIVRNPEKVEPPDWIGKKFSRGEGPGLLVLCKLGPANFSSGGHGVAADVRQLLRGTAWVLLWPLVKQEPQC